MSSTLKYFLFTSFIILSGSVQALSVGMGNDFQVGHTEGWTHALLNTNIPSVKLDDGPSGLGDTSLRVSASGDSGAGSRLLAFNRSAPWTGAVDANVSAIAMDLKQVSGDDLSIRIALKGAGTWYSSQTAFNLNASSFSWEHAIFDFSDLTKVNAGSATLATVLSNISEIRILHSVTNGFKGDKINATFAVDNISAVPVPAAFWLFGSGLLGLVMKKSSKKNAVA